jgi:hypothetical protein
VSGAKLDILEPLYGHFVDQLVVLINGVHADLVFHQELLDSVCPDLDVLLPVYGLDVALEELLIHRVELVVHSLYGRCLKYPLLNEKLKKRPQVFDLSIRVHKHIGLFDHLLIFGHFAIEQHQIARQFLLEEHLDI